MSSLNLGFYIVMISNRISYGLLIHMKKRNTKLQQYVFFIFSQRRIMYIISVNSVWRTVLTTFCKLRLEQAAASQKDTFARQCKSLYWNVLHSKPLRGPWKEGEKEWERESAVTCTCSCVKEKRLLRNPNSHAVTRLTESSHSRTHPDSPTQNTRNR